MKIKFKRDMGKNNLMRLTGLLIMCSILLGACTEYEMDGYTHKPIDIEVKGITTSEVVAGLCMESEVADSEADFTIG